MRSLATKINMGLLTVVFGLSVEAQTYKSAETVTFSKPSKKLDIRDSLNSDAGSQRTSNAPRVTDRHNLMKFTENSIGDNTGRLKSLSSLEGGIHGGGGNFVTLASGRKILLDLYLKDPSLSFLTKTQGGSQLPNTETFRNLGVDRMKVDGSLIQQARQKVLNWSNNSPKMASLIGKALLNTPYFYMKYAFNFQDQNYFIPETERFISKDNLSTAAIYSKNMGVLFSKSAFESLDSADQIATLIHEALRHIQITYGYNFSNEILQVITASLVLDDPAKASPLDIYLTYKSMDQVINEIKDAACVFLEKYPTQEVNCVEVRALTSGQDVFDITIKVAASVDESIKKVRTVPEVQAIGRDQANLLSQASQFTVIQMNQMTEYGRPTADNIFDVILDTRLIGLDRALENSNSADVQEKIKHAFDALLDLNFIKD